MPASPRSRSIVSLLTPYSSRLRQRRGILLLVVLSVLVLFLMIGTAFIIVAKQSEKAAKSSTQTTLKETSEIARGGLLDDVLLQIVRDTDNPLSVLRGESLLNDLYGNDGFRAQVANAQWAISPGTPASTTAPLGTTGGQMLQLELAINADFLSAVPGNQWAVDLYNQPILLSSIDDAYAGQLLTFVTDPPAPVGRSYSARGISTRIVSYGYMTGHVGPVLTVMAFPLANGQPLADPNNPSAGPALLNGSRILVNGRPFNGTGAGYDPSHPAGYTGPRLNTMELIGNQPFEVALLPNPVFYDPANFRLADPASPFPYFADTLGFTDYMGRGGADESYDAADFQNMILGLLPQEDGQHNSPDDSQTPGNSLDQLVLPSLHRPELINYWNAHLLAAGNPPLVSNPTLLRRVYLRPNWLDHPKFDGSNSQYAANLLAYNANPGDATTQANMLGSAIYGPWDVDNDSDGYRDSVWVDVGLPVVMGPNGKLVKPLAAILCVDLDGRLNVNTAGTLDLAGANQSQNKPDGQPQDLPLSFYNTANVATDDVPKGIGWGPAEISLEAALTQGGGGGGGGGPGGRQFFQQLLLGKSTGGPSTGSPLTGGPIVPGSVAHFLAGKYGVDIPLTTAGAAGPLGLGGTTPPPQPSPGRPLWFDAMGQVTLHGMPQYGNQRLRTVFALPPDLRARYSNAVNSFGQLALEGTLPAETATRTVNNRQVDGRLSADSPYEANLYAEGVNGENGVQALDAPFSLAELEHLLRAYDTDATTLPNRLAKLSGIDAGQARNRLTTESWDVPGPNVSLPHEMESLTQITGGAAPKPGPRPKSTAELFEMRVRKGLGLAVFPTPITDPDQLTKLRRVMRQLLAPELAAGQRLNINRALGNGIDDNNNGVVDEPGEDLVATQTWMWRNVAGVNPQDPRVVADPLDSNYANAFYAPLNVTFEGDADDGVGNLVDSYAGAGGPNEPPQVDGDSRLQRQLLARHLYVLALTLTAPADYLTDPTKLATDRQLAERMAQWAINVVDYRDADNIMTAFEYDLNPFDGWNPDGDLRTTADHVGPDNIAGNADDTYVWGAERPELLITETLAWHDRQTQDSIQEDPYPPTDKAGPTDPNDSNFDPDYDQIVRPRGALFIELYNPWSAQPGASADTHRIATQGDPTTGAAADMGVDLTKLDAATGTSPVWRMTIYKRGAVPIQQTTLWDPDARPTLTTNPPPNQLRQPQTPVDRSIYFSGFDPEFGPDPLNNPRTALWDNDGVAYYIDPSQERGPDPNDPTVGNSRYIPVVRPGRYMVVGSGEVYNNPGVFECPIGDRVNLEATAATRNIPRRRIELNTNVNGASRVRMVDDDGLTAVVDPATGYSVQAPAEVGGAARVPGMPMRLAQDNSPYVSDVAIIDRVWDRTDNYDDAQGATPGSHQQRFRRLTLSEPARGYITKFKDAVWSDRDHRYRNPERALIGVDIPLDGPVGGSTVLDARTNDNGDPVFNDMFPRPSYLTDARGANWNIDQALCTVGDLPTGGNVDDPRVSYGFIYLQRLANPLLPWNPAPMAGNNPSANGYNPNLEVNPYITVDGMSSNLTVFNGNEKNRTDTTPAGYEEDKELNGPNGTNTNLAAANFASLQRGDPALAIQNPRPMGANIHPRLWNAQAPSRGKNGSPRVPQNFYNVAQLTSRATRQVFLRVPFCTLGFLNTPFQRQPGVGAGGATPPAVQQLEPEPGKPLTWNPWNNRPYVSGNELMMVPRVRASQLLRQYTTDENVAAGGNNPYNDPVLDKPIIAAAAQPPAGNQQQTPPDISAFTHLERFTYDRTRSTTGNVPPQPSHLYRLLDYVGTPSLYAGAGEWLNPKWFGNTTGQAILPMPPGDPLLNRRAPFNWISEFREPGRVNLNTIVSENVYRGLFHADANDNVTPKANGDTHPGPQWTNNDNSFIRSRRGYGGANDDMLSLNPGMPTFFANPFRSGDAAALVPLDSMVRRVNGTGGGAPELRGVEGTLLRSTSASASVVDNDPLFAGDTELSYNNADRCAFFKYEPMIRLDSLVTTHSNVYAVWITIGFFEVEALEDTSPVLKNFPGVSTVAQGRLDPTFSRVYPDGYMYGKEDGLDEAAVRRLRGFYIIDRSRPVGFAPGVDNNVENAIRLKRRIE